MHLAFKFTLTHTSVTVQTQTAGYIHTSPLQTWTPNSFVDGTDRCGCPRKSGGNRWPLSSSCPSLESSAATTFRWGTAAGSGCSPPPPKGPHLHPRSVWNLTAGQKHKHWRKCQSFYQDVSDKSRGRICKITYSSVMKSNLTETV